MNDDKLDHVCRKNNVFGEEIFMCARIINVGMVII